MILVAVIRTPKKLRIPRESGDDPIGLMEALEQVTYSPRERG